MTNTTVTQCAGLVSGLGTRLGRFTASTSMPLLPNGGPPFMVWLLSEFVRFGVINMNSGHSSACGANDYGRRCGPQYKRWTMTFRMISPTEPEWTSAADFF